MSTPTVLPPTRRGEPSRPRRVGILSALLPAALSVAYAMVAVGLTFALESCAIPIQHQRSLRLLSDDVAGSCRRGIARTCSGPGASADAARALGSALTGEAAPARESEACRAARRSCAASVPCLRAVAGATAAWQRAAGEIAAKSELQADAVREAEVAERAARAECVGTEIRSSGVGGAGPDSGILVRGARVDSTEVR